MLKAGQPALTVLLGALIAVSPFAMDIYLASMPSMTTALATTPAKVQLTLSMYMYGLGIAQLAAGPLSDRWGRRRVLISGLVLFVVASFVCAAAPSIEVLIAARCVQALSVAVCATVPRALVRDLYSGADAAHILSLMGMVLGIAPIVAPIIGGQLFVWFGWRASFVFVTGYGVIALVASLAGLPETLKEANHRALHPSAMLANFALLLRSRVFVGYGLTSCCVYCGLFAFLAGSAFVFVSVMGSGAQGFGLLFGTVMVGNLTGAMISTRVGRRYGIDRVIRFATGLALAAGVAMAALAWTGLNHPLTIVVPMYFYMVALMMILPQAMAGAMTPFPAMAGAAASLQQFSQFVMASTAALIVGFTYDQTQRPMTTAIAVSSLLAFVTFRTFFRRP